MKRSLLLLLLCCAIAVGAHSQSFSLKELLTFKEQDIAFFHKAVTEKGYKCERSKYDERNEQYSYFYPQDADEALHEMRFEAGSKNAEITYETTNVKEYEEIKAQLELLEFKFVKYLSKQQHGRSVLILVYSDGNTEAHLYNSYIKNADDRLVRLYRIKVY